MKTHINTGIKVRAFAVAGVVGALLLSPGDASAGYVFSYHHASQCYNDMSTSYLRYADDGIKSIAGQTNDLLCPVTSTNWHYPAAANSVKVTGVVANSSYPIKAMACYASASGTSGTCSTQRSTSGTGLKSVDLTSDISVWAGVASPRFSYVHVSVGQGAVLYGIGLYWPWDYAGF